MYDTNVEYQIWCFCCNLFLSYADNRQNAKNVILGTRNLITCKILKISISKILPQNNTFSIITWIRESTNRFILLLFVRTKELQESEHNLPNECLYKCVCMHISQIDSTKLGHFRNLCMIHVLLHNKTN